jgi:hypothetical protein
LNRWLLAEESQFAMVTGVPSPAFPRTTAQRLLFRCLICLPEVPDGCEAEGDAEAEDDLDADADADADAEAEADDEVGGAVAPSTYQTVVQ